MKCCFMNLTTGTVFVLLVIYTLNLYVVAVVIGLLEFELIPGLKVSKFPIG